MIYFVTGTDTGAGKTHVTAALVTALRAVGRAARAVKPIETGWEPATSDAARLAAASGRSLEETVLYALAAPRSPRAAAALEGRALDARAVARWCRDQGGDPVLVEGAGGWMVPISDTARMQELSVALDARVIVVGRAGLGTINHCVLTVEAVQRVAPLAGVILSRRPEDDPAFARENAVEIARQTQARVAIVPEDMADIVDWFSGDELH